MTLASRIAALEAKRPSPADDAVSVILVTPLRALPEARQPCMWDLPMERISVAGRAHATLPGETGRAAVDRILAAMPDRPAVALAFPVGPAGAL